MSFTLYWVDKVTTGTLSFKSVILSSGTWFAAVPAAIIHYSDHFTWRLISQLIDSILHVVQKLHRYFNGTIISIIFIPSFLSFPAICCLNLNNILLLLLAIKSIILLLLSRTGSFL